jgi:polygalacturonase
MNRTKSGVGGIKMVGILITTFFLISGPGQNATAQSNQVPYDIAPVTAPFEMPHLDRPVFPDRTFDIRDYGAVERQAENEIKSTDAIHRTIEAAHKSGGGTVLIPRGTWLTGPIHLMSNINLHIADGAVLYFSTDRNDYLPVVRQRHEGVEAYNYSPLIYAYELKNVAVTGKGRLNAQGKHWWDWFREYGPPPRAIATKVPLSRRDFGKGAGREGMRPNFVVFWKCKNILIEGITLDDSPMWNIHLVYSRNAIVRNITVNSLDAPNGDGVVIDSSRDILIEYNRFETGDDAVVLKSGLNEEGLQINIPTENVVIRNFEAIDVRTGSGGVVFGSESSGGIRNIYVHDAYFEGSDRGVRFKTERGRGNIIENIYIRNIRMKNLTYEAINVNTFYTGPGAVGPSPLVRNVNISDIEIDGVPTAISLIGLPEKWLENFTLENIVIKNAERGARINRVKNLSLKNVEIVSNTRAMIAENIYELVFDNVMLRDNEDGAALLIKGDFAGAVILNEYPLSEVEFGEGATEDIIMKEERIQAW